MVQCVRFRLLLVLLITVTFFLQTSEAAVNRPIDISGTFHNTVPQINLEQMIQECPNFISYPGYDGVIWLKQHTYQIDTSGSMSVTTVWVILGKRDLEKKWLEWNIQIPKEGDAHIFEAALYDPGSLMQIKSIRPQREENEWNIDFGVVPEEFIMVLSYRQVYARNLAIQGMLWLNESLPVWENSVIAKVEGGREFEYVTNADIEPRITSDGDFDIYRWMVVNQKPALPRSLKADSRTWLAFGNKQPLSSFKKLLENYAKMPVPTPPSNAESWLKRGDFLSFFNWLNDQEINDSMLLRDEIPEKAPWSRLEKSIIASSWINRFNSGTCQLFWRLAVDPSQSGFANESIILGAAIEMRIRNDIFFYEIGQLYEPGATSLSLIGEALYAPVEGDRLDKRFIPSRGASDNRLSVIWDISVAEDNTTTGSISLIIRNLWKYFLLSDMSADEILTEITGRAAAETDIKTNRIKGGAVEISAPLKPGKIIIGTSGGNAIIPLNPPQPYWLRELAAAITPYSIKFPMSIEANYKISLPANVRNVLIPQQIDRDVGTIKYSEKYEYFRRRSRLDVTVRLTLSNIKMDEDMERDIAFALGRFGSQRSIPLRMR